jgi:hypothetical protein
MNDSRWVAIELPSTAIGLAVRVRLGDFGGRWLADVACGTTDSQAIGGSPREALVAALAPLGVRATAVLMAQPVMFAASADLLAREA